MAGPSIAGQLSSSWNGGFGGRFGLSPGGAIGGYNDSSWGSGGGLMGTMGLPASAYQQNYNPVAAYAQSHPAVSLAAQALGYSPVAAPSLSFSAPSRNNLSGIITNFAPENAPAFSGNRSPIGTWSMPNALDVQLGSTPTGRGDTTGLGNMNFTTPGGRQYQVPFNGGVLPNAQTQQPSQAFSGKVGGTQSGAFNGYNNGQAYTVNNVYQDVKNAWEQAFGVGYGAGAGKIGFNNAPVSKTDTPNTFKTMGVPTAPNTTATSQYFAPAAGVRNEQFASYNAVTPVKAEAQAFLTGQTETMPSISMMDDVQLQSFADVIPDDRVALALDAAAHKEGRLIDTTGIKIPVISNDKFNKMTDLSTKQYFKDRYTLDFTDNQRFAQYSQDKTQLKIDYGIKSMPDDKPFTVLTFVPGDFQAYGQFAGTVKDGQVYLYSGSLKYTPAYQRLLEAGYMPESGMVDTDGDGKADFFQYGINSILEDAVNQWFQQSDQFAFAAGVDINNRPNVGTMSFDYEAPSVLQLMPYSAFMKYTDAVSDISKGFDINGTQRTAGQAIAELEQMGNGNYALTPEYNANGYTGKIRGVPDTLEPLNPDGGSMSGNIGGFKEKTWGQQQSEIRQSDYAKFVDKLDAPEAVKKYFNRADIFDALYKKFRNSGTTLSWAEWLAQLNWSAEYERALSSSISTKQGGRTSRYRGGGVVPRLRSVSY